MSGGEGFDSELEAATDALEKLVRRLRSLSPRALQERRTYVEAALAALVAVNAQLEGRALDSPEVADHILADAVAVVGAEVLELIAARRDWNVLEAAMQALSVCLISTC